MNPISDALIGIGGKVVDSLDSLFTSDEERLKVKVRIDEVANAAKKDILSSISKRDEELTKRMQLDMQSDSFLSKNIRPASLIFLLAVYTLLALTDGNLRWDEYQFSVGESYVSGYQNFLMMAFAFYFGGRTIEKAVKLKPKLKKKPKKESQEEDDLFW